jgi:hypothetical protein
VNPRAGLDAVSKIKIPIPRRGSNLDRPARSQLLYQLSYPGSYVSYYVSNHLFSLVYRHVELLSIQKSD